MPKNTTPPFPRIAPPLVDRHPDEKPAFWKSKGRFSVSDDLDALIVKCHGMGRPIPSAHVSLLRLLVKDVYYKGPRTGWIPAADQYTLAVFTSFSERTIRRVISDLELLGWISRKSHQSQHLGSDIHLDFVWGKPSSSKSLSL